MIKAVIMAGGRGTRLRSVSGDRPKPMVKVGERPILEHLIVLLGRQGFKDIIITVGYKSEQIIEYFGDGRKYGVSIEYYLEKEPIGNAGALFHIKEKLSEDFLLLNADMMCNVDFNRFVEYHNAHEKRVTIFTHPNSHPYDSGIIIADKNKIVSNWLTKEDEKPQYYKNRVNAGIHVLKKKLLNTDYHSERVDLDRDLIKPQIAGENVICYDSPEYVRDMGTPERYDQVCRDYESGMIAKRTLTKKQKAVFLDRDGTINIKNGFINDPDQFELVCDAPEAISEINHSSCLAIIASNQPVIARGELTYEGLELIHNKMETLLGNEGAYIDDIFYCPHHPESGFVGEISELKKDCSCRKPKPGMLLEAADKYNIALKDSFMIGDSKIDMEAGKAAGCKTVLIGHDNYGQDYKTDSLLDAVRIAIK